MTPRISRSRREGGGRRGGRFAERESSRRSACLSSTSVQALMREKTWSACWRKAGPDLACSPVESSSKAQTCTAASYHLVHMSYSTVIPSQYREYDSCTRKTMMKPVITDAIWWAYGCSR
eukprot:4688739-Prymnesium_polylepis.1